MSSERRSAAGDDRVLRATVEVPDATSSPAMEIAHVLFMDVVAYSRLPMDEQQRVIHQLQELVRSTPEFEHAQADDQLIRLPTGDGMALVFFRDPQSPVRCALEVTKQLRNHPDIKVRMGIHCGPVYRVADINANRNVAGGGINIAQRVMDCGDGGHILVSAAMAEVLEQLSSWNSCLQDLGDTEVKHGVRVHLYNLCNAEGGNPEIPQKIRTAHNAAAQTKSGAVNKKRSIGLLAASAVVAVLIGGFFFTTRSVHALSDKDTIVLADFDNSTGDSVFDGTLKQALAVEIEQSPFLNALSEQKVRDTLQLMGESNGEHLTADQERQVCVRSGGKALLKGSISALGNQYVLGLNAINCATGDSLASGQTRAPGKEAVLDVLGKLGKTVRGKLGESLSSIRKYDTPLEEATTPSLDALSAYTMGRKTQREKGDAASITFFKRALYVDPKFALAYAGLAAAYNNLGQVQNASENAQKAFDLREHVSEREKLRITAFYYSYVNGDVTQALQAYDVWSQSYPRDYLPRANMGNLYILLGQYDKAIAATQEARRLEPENAHVYSNLATAYLGLGQTEQATKVVAQAAQERVDSTVLRVSRYQLGFLRDDTAEMARDVAWAAHLPGSEGVLLSTQSDTEAYFGRLRAARNVSQRAEDSSVGNDMPEAAAIWQGNEALREADFGNRELARKEAESAVKRAAGRQVWILAALTFARAGDEARADSLTKTLEQNYPSDLLLRNYWLPVIRGSSALERGDTAKAVELLQAVSPYDLVNPFPISSSPLGNMYSIYVRGQAYAQNHQAALAVAEFQKIIDQRGTVLNAPIGALAHVQLARAAELSGDTAKARAQYQEFLELWKNADPDIPILKEAKAESAKIQ
ncbi:MAG: tetratricopeptide repeat protein [Candidatus Acidiferrum sp.]|jgi:tetratricopeptide (TPR) repeat protein/class 3 adenylate cyclase